MISVDFCKEPDTLAIAVEVACRVKLVKMRRERTKLLG